MGTTFFYESVSVFLDVYCTHVNFLENIQLEIEFQTLILHHWCSFVFNEWITSSFVTSSFIHLYFASVFLKIIQNTEYDVLFSPCNLTNPRFVNFRTGQTTMRNWASRWEYMRPHISSKSADVIMWRASEIEQMNITARHRRASFLASKDASDTEEVWFSGLFNSCGLTQVVYTRLELINMFKAFFSLPQ